MKSELLRTQQIVWDLIQSGIGKRKWNNWKGNENDEKMDKISYCDNGMPDFNRMWQYDREVK